MTFFLLNTDNRLKFLHNILIGKNKSSVLESFEKITQSVKNGDAIILPPNFKWDTTNANLIPNNTNLICGNAQEEVLRIFKQNKINYFNLMQDETFVLKNAILTAEGFLADLILNTPTSIFEQKILILGGGRVAKTVAIILQKLGINFDITMRNNSKLIDAQIFTPNIINWKNFKTKLNKYNVIINTIPSEIFVKKDLYNLKKDVVIFELASVKCISEQTLNSLFQNLSPFTNLFNLNTNNTNNLLYVLSSALPGRYIPSSAGKLIYNYLKQQNFYKIKEN